MPANAAGLASSDLFARPDGTAVASVLDHDQGDDRDHDDGRDSTFPPAATRWAAVTDDVFHRRSRPQLTGAVPSTISGQDGPMNSGLLVILAGRRR
jgi:hypothetical protein